jgi:putative PIN family toxin of toxin-antitoxin system
MMRAVIDTNILIKARRSGGGASNRLLRAADAGRFRMLASVALFLEYEAVLLRPEHLLASRLSEEEACGFLNYLAGVVEPVRFHYRWRPQTSDPADEMVLETAINGQADCIVTFNDRHFGAAERFGIEVLWPADFLRRIG